jgi:aspartate/methionine/tyrosine aminotransferase
MPGWRLGWLVAPLDLVDAAYARMSNLFPPMCWPARGPAAFDAREELEGHIATYAKNRELMLAALPALGWPHRAARWRLLHLGRHRPSDQ